MFSTMRNALGNMVRLLAIPLPMGGGNRLPDQTGRDAAAVWSGNGVVAKPCGRLRNGFWSESRDGVGWKKNTLPCSKIGKTSLTQ